MHTLGYSFRPWKAAKSIADGPSILSYIKETAEEYGVTDRIRFGHRVVGAEWSQRRRALDRDCRAHRDRRDWSSCSAGFLMFCSGYYRYDQGYTPEIPGTDRFEGPIVHPQQWPEDLDYEGKRVVVIGSGATAITLVPAMARAGRARDDAAALAELRRQRCRPRTRSRACCAACCRRWPPTRPCASRTSALMALSYQLSRRRPRLMKALIRKGVLSQLPEEFDVDTHFTPRYDPWDQRLCVCPDGDLFRALSGRPRVDRDRPDPDLDRARDPAGERR